MDLGDQGPSLRRSELKFTLTFKRMFISPRSEIRDVPSPVYRPPVVAFVASAFVEISPWAIFYKNGQFLML